MTFAINIQGDEPFINPEQIDQVASSILASPEKVSIATLAKKIENQNTLLTDVNSPKAIFNKNGIALNFCRTVSQSYRQKRIL